MFTGMIDEYYGYCFGELEYRSLRFETETLDMENYQGNAVVNYTEYDVPYTRIIEHKHFEFGEQPKTVVTREYPAAWQHGAEPYYPINDDKKREDLSGDRPTPAYWRKYLYKGSRGYSGTSIWRTYFPYKQ